MTFADRIRSVVAEHGRLCVGIDPHAGLLRDWGLEDSAGGARELGLRVVEAARGRAGVVKPQIAFFERHGADGYAALADVMGAARAAGLFVLADVKRGDIGSTVDAYGEAWLTPGAALEADAMTAVAYQGVGSLAPVLARAEAAGKGVFVLAATSNPESVPLQGAVRRDGRTIARATVDEVREAGQAVVVGATAPLAELGLDTAALAGLPILAPGFGAQGARLADGPVLFGDAAGLVLAAASRSILEAGPEGLAAAIDGHVEEARW
ncbi:orotidine-5'-phosphate decarboxylase [Pseudolysinimonas sp.]|uniref:orotidine-5'-phosphate decarboxylase n=1 Tax=Pseudolysinimonas sp. TaxID=2680009 RepID=UPI003F7F9565